MEVFNTLCEYFSGDPHFESRGTVNANDQFIPYSLSKGILLMGGRGVGKKSLMWLFAGNKKIPYACIDCEDIAKGYNKKGSEYLDMYCKMLPVPASALNYFRTQVGICFVRLGAEKQKKHFGSASNVMEETLGALFTRYQYTSHLFSAFHATTRLTGDELEAKYGEDTRFNLRKMFNCIQLNGPDRGE
jgi:hypothetical protein